jgi:hypothetical protein
MPYHIGEKGSNGCSGYPVVSETGHVAGCHPTEANAQEQLGALYANVADASKTDCCPEDITKQEPCWDGYVQRGMKPGDNGKMVPNCVPAEKADDLWEDDDTVVYETDTVSKADGYSPPAGARSAARRAIKFKEDGKANGAGTAVGWTRAGQLARGESLSLSTVKRMYSYFSRHEVDKKGKDWGNSANPSNGYIMWLAWGGDAGFSWSRSIVNREKDKALFANFGKNYTIIKEDTPMDVSYNATVTDPTPANPSSSINPSVGMKKPQYMMNFGRQVGSGIKDKRVVDIWTLKADAPLPENPIMPTQTYEGCECDYCAENELTCSQCPQCGGMDRETQMAAYDASLGKSDETPQEQPQETAQPESFFNFRDLRPTRNTVRLGE